MKVKTKSNCDNIFKNCTGNATWSVYELTYVADVLYRMASRQHKRNISNFHRRAKRIGDVCPICKKSFY